MNYIERKLREELHELKEEIKRIKKQRAPEMEQFITQLTDAYKATNDMQLVLDDKNHSFKIFENDNTRIIINGNEIHYEKKRRN